MKVTPLRMAEFPLPEDHPAWPGDDEIYAFLIDHPEGPVLVDTGIGQGSEYVDKVFAPTRFDLTEALKTCGVSPDDISTVVNSHLHFDHCGNNQLFPNAKTFAGAEEIEDAREQYYTVMEWFDYEGANLCPVEDDIEILPGLTIMQTPGHTRGHLSVAIQDGRTEVVAAQAIYTWDECDQAARGGSQLQPGNWSDEAYAASRKKIFDLNPARIYMSHDHKVWEA